LRQFNENEIYLLKKKIRKIYEKYQYEYLDQFIPKTENTYPKDQTMADLFNEATPDPETTKDFVKEVVDQVMK
jgi:hypothetical protein